MKHKNKSQNAKFWQMFFESMTLKDWIPLMLSIVSLMVAMFGLFNLI